MGQSPIPTKLYKFLVEEKHMKVRITPLISICLFVMFSLTNILATPLSILSFDADDSKLSYLISFGIEKTEIMQEQNTFTMSFYHNGQLQVRKCEVPLNFSSTQYLKTSCEIPKLGDGQYTFVAKIENENGEQLYQLFHTELKSETSANASFSFTDKENSTTITISLPDTGENVQISQYIPKSVIESLTEENKDLLIQSELPYEILDSDPLIAWTVEETPTQFNYTINKETTLEDKKDFTLEFTKTPLFSFIQIVLVIFIVFLLLLLVYPALKKKQSSKKNSKK